MTAHRPIALIAGSAGTHVTVQAMKAYETGHAEPDDYLASPIYGVNFWERPAPGFAFNLDAVVLVDASGVDEVLQWAATRARGRTYEVMVEAREEQVDLDCRSARQRYFASPARIRTKSRARRSGWNSSGSATGRPLSTRM